VVAVVLDCVVLQRTTTGKRFARKQGTTVEATTVENGLWTKLTTSALLLGIVHALVDAACGFLIFRDLGAGYFDHQTVVYLVLLYNSLAFGGQVPVGLVADRYRNYRTVAILGAGLTAVALLLSPTATVAGIVIVGVGNAMFHVGAGALVLRSSGERSTESGVFVGPGAVGLCAGIWLGGQPQIPCRGVIVVALLLSAPALLQVTKSARLRRKAKLPQVRPTLTVLVIICAACLLGSVSVRALVGGSVAGTWRGVSLEVMVALAVAACSGKMLGGFVSDRVGWTTLSVSALVLSAPLITLAVGTPAGAVLGMLLFQMTMPVTLKAMHHVLPDRPGLAFGVPCLALIIGAVPGLLGFGYLLRSWSVVAGLLVVSTVMIGTGLILLVRVGASGGPAPELAARLVRAR